MPGYHQILVRWDNRNEAPAVIGANRIGISLIPFAIELDAEVSQTTAGLPSHPGSAFSDPAGEDQEVESAQRCGKRADLLSELIAEHLHCRRSMRLGISSLEQRLHVRDA